MLLAAAAEMGCDALSIHLYLGHWQKVGEPSETMEIRAEGRALDVVYAFPESGTMTVRAIVTTDGRIVIPLPTMKPFAAIADYDRATGQITAGEYRYQRTK